MITFEEFSRSVARTANTELTDNEAKTNALFGLVGEAGEVVDYIKKVKYQGHAFELDKLINEMGDVLYYAEYIAQKYGFTLQEAMQANKEKLTKRYPNGFVPKDSIIRIDVKNEPTSTKEGLSHWFEKDCF